jgi:DNA-binding transcriptional regulator YdaS (Cro superfamily)
MELREFISEPARLDRLAKKVKSHPGYLRQVATGWRGARASFNLALRIELATGGEVTKESLRPDIWGDKKKAA